MLGVDGRVNAILVAGRSSSDPASVQSEEALQASLHPTLGDYGIAIHKTDRGYFNITSDRMLLEPAIETAVMKSLAADHPQPVFTYLANYILAGDGRGKIPYSTVAAVDFAEQPPLGPLVNRDGQPIGPIGDDEIVLNSWAADDLAAQGVNVKPGDPIELTYFEPESTHGNVVETKHQFHLKDIAKLEGAAADRNLTPEVKGVTDEASIADWNPPFPYDAKRVRSTPPNNQDDLYWRQYKATPKAFVSLEQGRNLWGSRFGNTTSIRLAAKEGVTEQSLAAQLEHDLNPAAAGFQFLPVKRLSLTAAAGTTPFAVLFLAFSMFIIAAALMLLAVLFKLGVDARAAELGITLAVGFRRRIVAADDARRRQFRRAGRGVVRCVDRHRLRVADARRPENLVARGDFHAVSGTLHSAVKLARWLSLRGAGFVGNHRLGLAADAASERAALAGRADRGTADARRTSRRLGSLDCRGPFGCRNRHCDFRRTTWRRSPSGGIFTRRRPGLGIGTYGSLAAAASRFAFRVHRQPRGLAATGHPQ